MCMHMCVIGGVKAEREINEFPVTVSFSDTKKNIMGG